MQSHIPPPPPAVCVTISNWFEELAEFVDAFDVAPKRRALIRTVLDIAESVAIDLNRIATAQEKIAKAQEEIAAALRHADREV